MSTLKQTAQEFLTLCARGDSRKAFAQYASKNFIHHNAYFKGDAETLMVAMEENAQQMPHKIFEIKRTLEDGDLVAVHSHFRQDSKDLGAAVMHIFRFEGEKILELWDFSQPVPKDMPNENGMF
ncbi:nuclear transport factor 2 family protein [Echinicola sp. 20G]|uniref:nuclear transport factor 2 family protein n=1 Tax=Echinicola sp. 20G TaxID=2781961 RepID=UPI0019106D0C|nr:nuclear transport factor 2 family protein [Echinicola sp. 20G]